MTTTDDAASYSWPLLVEAQGQLVRASQPPLLSELVEPVDLFAKLVREVEAGQALVALAMTDHEQRLAALDALALARDVLDDARRSLVAAGFPADGRSTSSPAPAAPQTVEAEPASDYAWSNDELSDDPAGFVTTRTSCACGDAELVDGDVVQLDDGLQHGGPACVRVLP